MRKPISILVGLLMLMSLVAGCAATRLDMDWGTSQKLATYNQTLNPEAEKNLKPVAGLDGQSARKSMDRYHKDFEKPEKPPVYSFVLGSGGTAQK
jgi:hypothetical protein